MKTARTLNYVPQQLQDVPELSKAFAIASEANLDEDELADLERREMFIQDQRGAITKATRLGIEQGIKQGKLALIVSLLEPSLGVLPSEIKTRIGQLSDEQLKSLVAAVFELKNLSDLTAWFEANC
jgi:flagellar biosynthesis/type III secretory pathway protein FliH